MDKGDKGKGKDDKPKGQSKGNPFRKGRPGSPKPSTRGGYRK